MNEKQEQMWDMLCELDGETVARLFTDYHGNQLLDDGFREFLQDEGYLELDEELEDNCENGTYDCDTCINNGDCIRQGEDGRPFWEECDGDCENCSRTSICENYYEEDET